MFWATHSSGFDRATRCTHDTKWLRNPDGLFFRSSDFLWVGRVHSLRRSQQRFHLIIWALEKKIVLVASARDACGMGYMLEVPRVVEGNLVGLQLGLQGLRWCTLALVFVFPHWHSPWATPSEQLCKENCCGALILFLVIHCESLYSQMLFLKILFRN